MFSRSWILVILLFLVADGTLAFAPVIHKTNTPSSSLLSATTSIVWFTGHEDLRLNNGGFMGALEEQEGNDDRVIQPVFILDPAIHLQSKSSSAVTRLHKCLSSLEQDIASCKSSVVSPLLLHTGSACTLLPQLVQELENVDSCHVINNDVVSSMRRSQQDTCQALTNMDITVKRWTNALRPSAPWATSSSASTMTSFYPDYCQILKEVHIAQLPKNNVAATTTTAITQAEQSAIPSLSEFFDLGQSVTPSAVTDFRSNSDSASHTVEPYDDLITNQFTSGKEIQSALNDYQRMGKDDFSNKYFTSPSKDSMYAASMARVVEGSNSASDGLALREVPTRTFSSALAMGTTSARTVMSTIQNPAIPDNNPWSWGRSSDESLSDMVEWREWFRLLADRSLSLQEQGQAGATSGGEKEQAGNAREAGTVQYWRWKEQYLVRYLTWPAGKEYTSDDGPSMLLVHGFAASAEQWERLVYSLRKEHTSEDGKDTTPPIYAVDLLGFGHSEKPGLSYTQYLWEAQLVDFAVEVMEATPLVMVGNSIGGGLSAGAAASLGSTICQGLVLCNTAGILVDPDDYEGYDNADTTIRTWTEAALQGNPKEAPYGPVPLLGNNALDAFGTAIIQLIYPQIEKRLNLIYGNNIENADPAVAYAIQQSAAGPGSANVIGSGQKLAPNRPLNEVLEDLQVLVVMGLDDQVSSPIAAQIRAKLFSKLYPNTVTVEAIEDAGHCPHDEQPDMVASAIYKWSSLASLTTQKEEQTKVNV